MRSHIFLAILVSVSTALQEQIAIGDDIVTADTIHDKLIGSQIIPEVLDDFEPSIYIDLHFPKYEKVLLGNTIQTKHAKNPPVFTLTTLGLPHDDDGGSKTYTLILTDPDATSRNNPKWSEMCHWVLTNVSAPVQIQSDYMAQHSPVELVNYLAPAPPKKTGPHRYVFVLLEGTSTHLLGPRKRKHWGYKKIRHGVRDWAADNDLKVVGANFFFAQHRKQ